MVGEHKVSVDFNFNTSKGGMRESERLLIRVDIFPSHSKTKTKIASDEKNALSRRAYERVWDRVI